MRSLRIYLRQSLPICLFLCLVCLQSPPPPPPPPFLPRNRCPFISRDLSPLMAQKIRVFNAPVLERETSLRRGKGGNAATYPRPLRIHQSSSLQRRASTLLRSATPQRGMPRCYVPEALLLHFFVSSLLQFFSSIIQLPFLFQCRHVL